MPRVDWRPLPLGPGSGRDPDVERHRVLEWFDTDAHLITVFEAVVYGEAMDGRSDQAAEDCRVFYLVRLPSRTLLSSRGDTRKLVSCRRPSASSSVTTFRSAATRMTPIVP